MNSNTQILIPGDASTLSKFLSIAQTGHYRLPGNPGDAYVIGVSGGADSTALAILMTSLFPDTEFVLLFTDTLQEVKDTYAALDRLEAFTHTRIVRVNDGDGLYDLIAHYKGFLPAANARYCTRILKIETAENYFEKLKSTLPENASIHNFVGLRADESDRDGYDPTMSWMQSHFPLQDLGIVREDVFNILTETVGIPSFYRHKSRSSCSICPFHRPSELLGTLHHDPAEFYKAESLEKLTDEDKRKYAINGPDWSGTFIHFPVPDSLDLTKVSYDLFGQAMDTTVEYPQTAYVDHDLFASQTQRLYVGVEYLIAPLMNLFGGSPAGSSGVYHNELIGWSTTQAGLTRKLATHYWTRHDTCEAFYLTPDAFLEEYKIGVFVIDMPSTLACLAPTSEKTYAWRQDEPLQKIRQIANAIKRTLHVQMMKDEIARYLPYAKPNTWEDEEVAGLKRKLKHAMTLEIGQLISASVKAPPSTRPIITNPEALPCTVCSK